MRRFRNSRRVFETFGWLKCFWDKKLKPDLKKQKPDEKNYQKTIEFGRTKL